MNILIVGCNGFIGSNAFKYFKNKNFKVFGCDIQQLNTETFLLQHDLSNLSLLFEAHQFDVCINASGSSTVSFSLQNVQEDYKLNYKNVEIILEWIKNNQPKCKLINLSSAAVYGNPSKLPINENDSTKPISPYGKHKLLSEQLLKTYAVESRMLTHSLRIFSVYGNGLKKQLFWDIYQKAKQAESIELYGTGNETRDFIHIEDLMLAFEKIIFLGSFDGSAINVASGSECTINLAAHTLIQNLNSDFKLKFSGIENNMDPKYWRADISLLKKMGFLPKVGLNEGLKNYATWLKELN
jgi:dTDP-glucose 4,6-dehydratase/UDP-glucose 4-epimerase